MAMALQADSIKQMQDVRLVLDEELSVTNVSVLGIRWL